METMLLRLFQSHVEDQCEYVLLARDQIVTALADMNAPIPKPTEGHEAFTRAMQAQQEAGMRLWFGMQNLLNAGANISKALWGPAGKLVEERRPLRESLGVPDDSPLAPTDLRNDFEHFDDRLDHWWKDSPNHNIADRTIGPEGMIAGSAIGPDDIFRHFDPTTGMASFRGTRFNLTELIQAIDTLLPEARREAARPHWDPRSKTGSGQ
jgi:hypothetical protein